MPKLLPPDSLAGVRVGISVSESPDLARLGLPEAHLRTVLGEIARVVLVAGGSLAYGGYLDPSGYSGFLYSELRRYGRRDRPLLVCLAWNGHRKLSLSELDSLRDLGMLGRVVCLDPDGIEIEPESGRGEEPVPEQDPQVQQAALTAMRGYLCEHSQARVLLGGRRHGFEGRMPGVMEEAIMSLRRNQPLYPASGYGGVTLHIVRALRVDDCAWLPNDDEAPAPDPGFTEGQAQLRALADDPNWHGLANGLSVDENRRLTASHRPSDIATLVGLGLGRLAAER
jgi:SLOG cluster2